MNDQSMGKGAGKGMGKDGPKRFFGPPKGNRPFEPRGKPPFQKKPFGRGPRPGQGFAPRGKFFKKRIRSREPLVEPSTLQRGPASRFQALEILIEADKTGRFVDLILEDRILHDRVHGEDKQLVQEIVFGAIRHRNTLDQILDSYIQFAMKRQHVAVRWALRLAAYQLVYLSRIPSHAAIHGSVEALKAIPGIDARDAGFLNAVLRRIHLDIAGKTEEPPADANDPRIIPARHGWCIFKKPILPRPTIGKSIFLAIKYSHPKWLLSRWISRFGEEETVQLCIANNRVPLVTAILTAKAPAKDDVVASLTAAGVVTEPGVIPEAVRLRKSGDVRKLEAFQKGWIRIQDETAKAIGDALAPPPGSRVLDLCAAPGGKAAQILERIGPGGHLIACDVDPSKLPRLRENLERVGSNFTVLEIPPDPERLPASETFTHILVDVPCSNTGVLARRPEARWRIHQEDLLTLAKLQGRILEAALRRLAPGGRLVYATCSIEPEENGQVVATARARHPGLVEEASRLFLPQRDGADGGYYAILQAPKENWPPQRR
jgi:16S rRNA (cytosine967-C5)-methyltransferase